MKVSVWFFWFFPPGLITLHKKTALQGEEPRQWTVARRRKMPIWNCDSGILFVHQPSEKDGAYVCVCVFGARASRLSLGQMLPQGWEVVPGIIKKQRHISSFIKQLPANESPQGGQQKKREVYRRRSTTQAMNSQTEIKGTERLTGHQSEQAKWRFMMMIVFFFLEKSPHSQMLTV